MKHALLPGLVVATIGGLIGWAAAANAQQNNRVDLVALCLSAPTDLAFAPDGRCFVADQSGVVSLIKGGVRLTDPVATFQVLNLSESGLIGITLHPDFPASPYLYVHYTVAGPPAFNRISRVTLSGDSAVPNSETVLFESDAFGTTNVQVGGAMRFGPDGKLYVGLGYNRNDAAAQSLNTTLGKLLRLNADGTVPTDNPFLAQTSGRNRYIWALGLRDPFSFDFSKATGQMLINDTGANTWEEIDVGVAGANYGWPIYEGPSSNSAFQAPLFYYAHNAGRCAITGSASWNPAPSAKHGFDRSFLGTYFYGDYCTAEIFSLDSSTAQPTSRLLIDLPFVIVALSEFDGDLYYLNRNGSMTGLYRIRNVLSRFAAWQGVFFSPAEIANPAVGGFSSDLEGDGVPNFMEYACGTAARAPDAAARPILGSASVQGTTYPTITYQLAKDPTDVLASVEVSSNLQTWLSGQAVLVGTVDRGDTTQVTYRSQTPLQPGQRQFLRVRFTATAN